MDSLRESGRQALPTQECEARARLIEQQLFARNAAGAEEPPDRLHPAPVKGFRGWFRHDCANNFTAFRIALPKA
jgi:hypothetical protein